MITRTTDLLFPSNIHNLTIGAIIVERASGAELTSEGLVHMRDTRLTNSIILGFGSILKGSHDRSHRSLQAGRVSTLAGLSDFPIGRVKNAIGARHGDGAGLAEVAGMSQSTLLT